jgi:hypothetical protein
MRRFVMTGEANWLPLAIWLVGLAVVLLMAWLAVGAWSRFFRRQLVVTCPKTGEQYECVLKGDKTRDGMFTDVERCSAFEDPDHVTCEKTCLHTLHAKHT